jgi:hypothetical protein
MNDPLRLGQLAGDVEQARERFAGINCKSGEDVPVRLGPDRARPHCRLAGTTRPAQRDACRKRGREVRLEIEATGGRGARLRAA